MADRPEDENEETLLPAEAGSLLIEQDPQPARGMLIAPDASEKIGTVPTVMDVGNRPSIFFFRQTLVARVRGELPPSRPISSETQPERPRGSSGFRSFFVFFLAPVSAAIFYYFFVASSQYVSAFEFAVTQSSSPSIASPVPSTGTSAASAQGVSSLLGGLGVANLATTQNYMVMRYILSQQVVEDISKTVDIRKLYSKSSIDWLSRYDGSPSIEHLTQYWQRMVAARYDPITGIATAEVRAFSPADANLIATTLVTLSEKLVNQIDMRPKLDAVQFAENDVQRAELRMKRARAALTDFRNKEGVIDPTVSIVAGNTQDTATVRATLIQLQTQLDTMKEEGNENSPMANVLRSQIRATKSRLSALESQVAKSSISGNSNSSLAGVMKAFEQLDLERQYAQNLLVNTMAMLDQARSAAGQQNLYLTPFVRPDTATSPTYPARLESVLAVTAASFGTWLVFLLAYRAIRDRG